MSSRSGTDRAYRRRTRDVKNALSTPRDPCVVGAARGYDGAMAFLAAFVIPLVIGFWAQHKVKSTFAKNLQVPVANGMTGAQVARQILNANGLDQVPVEETPGSLSDHYDPRSRSVHLSPDVYHGVSVASTAVGAHEVGHAIQHAKSYAFFRSAARCSPRCSSRRTSGCSS